jgi:hypothetical protein
MTIAPAENDPPSKVAPEAVGYMDETTGEPLLTADELRALLQDPPAASPSGGE